MQILRALLFLTFIALFGQIPAIAAPYSLILEAPITSEIDDSQVILAQRLGTWGRNNMWRNQQRMQQQRMQQQRMRQQRLQQQRQRRMMEQRRRQMAEQRRRMQEQRRRQQQAMRMRRQQMLQQRQRMAEQRRLRQNRQRQQLQRRQGQQRQATQTRTLQAQRIARTQLLDRQRLLRLRQLRERTRKVQLQRTQQRTRDAAMLTSIRTARSVSSLKSPTFAKRLQKTKSNLQKVRAQQVRVNPKAAQKVSKNATEVARLAKLKSQINCVGSSCRCSFHGSTLVKASRGMVPIREIKAGEDYVWSRDEFSGEQDWKLVTNHYSNNYDEIVEVKIEDKSGHTQTILSNRIHPFFAKIPSSKRQFHLSSHRPTVTAVKYSSEGHIYHGQIEGGHWIDAANLKKGYRLLNGDGTWSQVASIHVREEEFRAYNLTVSGFHTYFVGANKVRSVWVHNNCRTYDTERQASRYVKRGANIPTSAQPTNQGKTARGDKYYIYKIRAAGGRVEYRAVVKSVGDPKAGHNYTHYEAGRVKVRGGKLQYNSHGIPRLENTGKIKSIVR